MNLHTCVLFGLLLSIQARVSKNSVTESEETGASFLKVTENRGFLGFLFDPCKCRCGVPNREGRLIGGENLLTHEFPWLVLIHIKSINRGIGTLINNKYVITSSTQLIGLTPYDVKMTLAQYDRCSPDISSLNVSIERIIIHPDFNPANRAHDLALLKISQPVTFERRISPICLAFPGNTYVGQVSTVVGWFTNPTVDVEDTSSCRPRKLGLPVLGFSQCLAANPEMNGVDKGCLGVVGSPSVICEADTGSPVFYRSYGGIYELIGILTDRNQCSLESSVSFYTLINKHLTWITQNTKDACYCYKSR